MAIELYSDSADGARLRVVGVGGGGGNAVRTMIMRGLEGVEFIVANTDHQALAQNPAPTKLQLGQSTRGLGAGANPERGRQAVEESLDDVRAALEGSDMIFVTAGMGGGTGTGAAPVIARIGRELGALVVGIVTKPFKFEARRRMSVAEQGLRELRDEVDALIVIPNERILSIIDANVSFTDAMGMVDDVLFNATKGIADIISGTGFINVDFADVRAVMTNMGDALMGIGVARGENREIEAAYRALNSPILEGLSIAGSQGVLVNISGSTSMTMHEVSEAVSAIEEAAGEEVNLIHGVVIDDRMTDEISVTVVATGFPHKDERDERDLVSGSVSAVGTRSAERAPVIQILPPRPAEPTVPAPQGADELESYDVPAYVRRRHQTEQQQQASAPVPSGSIPIRQQRAAAGGAGGAYPGVPLPPDGSGGNNDKPAFLRKIMD
jgi:cell division protein FtsZ